MDLTSAAFRFYPAGNAIDRHSAAGSLQLRQLQVPWNIDDELARTQIVTPALPVAINQGRVSSNRRADFVGFEFPLGLSLIRTIRTSADHISNVLLRAALHANRAEVHPNTKVFCRRERASDLFGPRLPLVNDPRLLRSRDRNQECHCCQHSGEL